MIESVDPWGIDISESSREMDVNHMSGRTIVVIEDEDPIRRGLCDALTAFGYDPVAAADGESGLDTAQRLSPSLVLLDLAMPKMDGMTVLAELRKTHPTLPVIIITARGSEDDRVRGLKLGADDYVVKPFSARELLARVEAVLRRSPDRPHPVRSIESDGHVVDLDRAEVRFPDDDVISLSEMEADIFRYLANNADRVITREELLARVWGIDDQNLETRAVDMHITRLRTKLDRGGSDQPIQWIKTVRGKGYMLAGDIHITRREASAE
jgi:two-component system, OmpR family, response regulator RpaB